MGKFQSTKLFDGFSCVFRQWKAENTHCRFMHGYGVRSVPTLVLVDQTGKELNRIVGYVSENQVKQFYNG